MNYNSADISSRDSIPNKVLQQMRINIILRKYLPKTRLIESKLSEEYNVSRGSIRAALQILEKEGMIEGLPSGGKQVIGFTKKDIVDMYDLRLLLETKAIDTIIKNDHMFYTPMLDVLNKVEKYRDDPGMADWFDLDIQFHRAIMIMANNRPLLQSWEIISQVMNVLVNINSTTGYKDQYIKEFYFKHKEIVDSIITKDPKSTSIITTHIVDAEKITLRLLEKMEHDSSSSK